MASSDILQQLAAAALRLRERQAMVDTCLRLIAELETGRIVPVEGERTLVTEMAQTLEAAYRNMEALPAKDAEARLRAVDTLLDDVGWELVEELQPVLERKVQEQLKLLLAARVELNDARTRFDKLAATMDQIRIEGASIAALEDDRKAAKSSIASLESSFTDRTYDRLAEKLAATRETVSRLEAHLQRDDERIGKIRALVKQADLLIMQTALASGDFEYRILLRCADRSQTRGINIIQDVKKLTKSDRDWMLDQVAALTQGINLRLSREHKARKAPAARTLTPADASPPPSAEPGDPASIMQTLGTFMKRMVIPDQMRELLMSQDWSFSITTNDLALPWELMFFELSDAGRSNKGAATERTADDQETFFCLSKSLSRMPLGKVFPRPERRYPGDPKKKRRMLLIHSDPHHNLPAAATEIDTIARDLGDRLEIVRLTPEQADNTRLNEILMGPPFDFIHYAGHASFDSTTPGDSGLLLRDDVVLSADKIGALNRGGVLVFLNACESGTVATANQPQAVSYLMNKPEPVVGLASAFVYSGAMGCVGSLWPVYDAAAAAFAVDFYHHVLDGDPIGEALRHARRSTRDRFPDGATWAGYVLYGDPTYRLPHSD